MQRIAPPPPPAPNVTRPPAQLPMIKPRASPPTRPPPISDHIIQVVYVLFKTITMQKMYGFP